MIITRTPFRISFAGGGSDLQDYYLEKGGAVLNVTINKYVYLTVHPFFHEKKILLKYSKHELVDNVDDIEHRIIREVFREYNLTGVDFNSSADVPSGTGLGSSSAFTVGLINLCNVFTGRYMSKEKIAEHACEVEIKRLCEPIGKQDQYASAIGGMNFISFNRDDSVSVEKMIMHKDKYRELNNNLLMFYLGSTRAASQILAEQKSNMRSDSAVIGNIQKMVDLAHELRNELLNNNIEAMGDILHRGWMYKKELASSISNERIDHYYDLAMKNGARGGKLLGAGGSGFLLFYVDPENREKVITALSDLDKIDYEFDNTGTTVIYYDENR